MRTAWVPAGALLLFAPVCAEYLWGYDDTTGNAVELVFALIIFGPLYGAPALLIRETARRLDLGWPGILLLAGAFGLIQAGVVDQSMFSQDYRDIPYWDDMSVPTYLPALGLSIYPALTFVGGHMILSIGSPIAIVESLTPGRRHAPWLSRPMIGVVALLWLAASALVLGDALSTETDHATAGEVIGALLAAAAFVAAALAVGRRRVTVTWRRLASPPRRGWSHSAVLLAMGCFTMLPPSRTGTAVLAAVVLLTVVAVARLSRRSGWGQRHVLALAAGALVATGIAAFATTPLGDVSDAAKYGHNVTLLLLVAALSAWGVHRARALDSTRPPGRDSVSG